jgi:hypothetical protein
MHLDFGPAGRVFPTAWPARVALGSAAAVVAVRPDSNAATSCALNPGVSAWAMLRAMTALRWLAWASLAEARAKTSIPASMVENPVTSFLRGKLGCLREESV